VLERISKAERSRRPSRRWADRAGRAGSFRDAVSLLDQLSRRPSASSSVQAVLQLLGVIEEDALFRLIDLVVAGYSRRARGNRGVVDQGQDLGRLIGDCSSTSAT